MSGLGVKGVCFCIVDDFVSCYFIVVLVVVVFEIIWIKFYDKLIIF